MRKDAGKRRRIEPALVEAIRRQYTEHPTWRCRLHDDNLLALAKKDDKLAVPSYPTVRRFMKSQGLLRQRRKSDGTCSIEGVRFEIPAHYRHIERVHVRYARWNLGHATLVDPVHGTPLCALYPLDKARNADRRRRALDPAQGLPEPPAETGIAPHLAQLMAEYAATGLPPAYLPYPNQDEENDES